MLGLKWNGIFLTVAVPGQNARTPVDHSRAFAIVCSKWLLLWIQVGKTHQLLLLQHTGTCWEADASKVRDTHTILCMCSILFSSSYQGKDNRLLLRCLHLCPSELFWMVSVNPEILNNLMRGQTCWSPHRVMCGVLYHPNLLLSSFLH